ncbi:hypothetical protein Dalk_1589 [Desulfatibacillum aliphaticivorans]|uniref:DUF4352 domain-containing protein n=1 Tax=Desulfatibacillum aliphaticivorans TaxID=218208 RepID=B8FAJ1_DESAL|nr:hypothetical protein [Desulfatibacillum aliphaticivorans]ACL03287.1 hypothetical protein Dalk_1589 [Desulfatibacillum aliphaticivorans]
MKFRRSASVLALLTVFLLGQFAFAGQPIKMQTAPAKVQPAINKNVAKQAPLVDPKISILGIQTRNMQTLSMVEYEVKIKNDATEPYKGMAQLALDVKSIIPPGENIFWEEGTPAKEIGPLAPGEEKSFRGQMSRKGSAVSLRASIKTKDKVWQSRTVKMAEMPAPEVEITNLEIRDGKVYATIKNKSGYQIDPNGGLLIQFYGGVKQADGSVAFSPAGGRSMALAPHGESTQSATIRDGFDLYKVTLFLSRGKTNITADSKLINL